MAKKAIRADKIRSLEYQQTTDDLFIFPLITCLRDPSNEEYSKAPRALRPRGINPLCPRGSYVTDADTKNR